MRIELLVDSGEFWQRLRTDISEAQTRIRIQTLSFEGDRAGTALARAVHRASASDRQLLIDSFSLLYHNDRIIPGPAWLEPAFRREVHLTHRWVRRLREGGTEVRFGNPVTLNPLSLIRRNHKKIAVIDGRITYLGGINFSDHNFAWRDMMLRVEDEEMATLVEEDFSATWSGRPTSGDSQVGPFRVLSLNGRGNGAVLRPVLEAIDSATQSIDVVSPYLSPPFTGRLASARERGVQVRVLTPSENNKSDLGHHIREAAHRHGFQLAGYEGGMSHMKAMVIDDDLLVAGSLNYDFLGFHIMDELLIMTRDPGIREAFVARIWEPDWSAGIPIPGKSTLLQRVGHRIVHLWERLARAAAYGPDR